MKFKNFSIFIAIILAVGAIWKFSNNRPIDSTSHYEEPKEQQSNVALDLKPHNIASVKPQLETIFAQIPRVSEWQKTNPTDSHYTPAAVEAFAPLLTQLDSLANAPENEGSLTEFYLSCAHNEDIFTSVQAACLHKLIQLKKRNGKEADLSQFPSELTRLVSLVPVTP